MMLGVIFVLALFFGLANHGYAEEKGLVGLWKFDEGKGDIAEDSTSEGNNGNVHGATWTEDGKVGNALKFDGVNNYVEIPNSGSLQATPNSFSLEVWVKWTEAPSGDYYGYIIHRNNAQSIGGSVYALSATPNGSIAFSWQDISGSPVTLNSGAGENDGIWHNVIGVWDGSKVKLYIDAELIDEKDYTTAMINKDCYLTIGSTRYSPTHRPFNGAIDEVRIYNRALTATEVENLYKKGRDSLVF